MDQKLTVVLKGQAAPHVFKHVYVDTTNYRLGVFSAQTNQQVAGFDMDGIERWYLTVVFGGFKLNPAA
jgi:hypothetical protein